MTERETRRRLAGASLIVAGIAVYVLQERVALFHALPPQSPDSASYLEGNIARTPAYPLFLSLFPRTPRGLEWVGPVQHAALLLAAGVLVVQFARAFERPALAALLGLAIVLNPLVIGYSFTILPEALFIAVLMIHLGSVLALARGWSRGRATIAGVTAAALTLLKPVGYASIAALGVLALVRPREWRDRLWPIASASAVLLIASVANYPARGIFGIQAQGGYSRVAYVGHLVDDSVSTPYPQVARRIAAQTADVRRMLHAIDDPTVYVLVGANQYHLVEDVVRREIVAEIGNERGAPVDDERPYPSDPDVILGINRIGGAIADATIRQRPSEYTRQVALNVGALWWQPLIQSPRTVDDLRARIDAAEAGFSAIDRSPMAFRVWPSVVWAAARLLLAAVTFCAVGAIVFLWTGSPRAHVIGYVAILVHASFLLVSAVQPALPRYALAFWPASMLVLFGSLAVAFDRQAPLTRRAFSRGSR